MSFVFKKQKLKIIFPLDKFKTDLFKYKWTKGL